MLTGPSSDNRSCFLSCLSRSFSCLPIQTLGAERTVQHTARGVAERRQTRSDPNSQKTYVDRHDARTYTAPTYQDDGDESVIYYAKSLHHVKTRGEPTVMEIHIDFNMYQRDDSGTKGI